MANIRSIGGNPIVLGMDGLDNEVKRNLTSSSGYSDLLTAGAADGIKGGGPTVDAAFLHRVTGGGQASDGPATIEVVRGNTLVWNQLIKLVSNVSPAFGVTITTNPATGMVSYNGTTTQGGGRNNYIATRIPLISGHKYLLIDTINYADGNTVKWVLSDTTTTSYIGELTGGTIYTAGSDHTCWIGKNFSAAGEVYDCSGYVSFYDLTQMFGAGNEPSTVAEFEALFPDPYYEYDAGSLLSVNMEGIETVGFNQLNPAKMAALARVTESCGVFTGDGSDFRSGMVTGWEDIKFFPGMQYEASFKIESATASGINPRFTFIYTDGTSSDGTISNGTATTISTAGKTVDHISFNYSNNGSVSLSSPCLHLVWSGRRNGEYEAFWKSQRLINVASYFPDGMRSAGTVRDELTSTEAITRVGVVDLGTLTWSKNGNVAGQFFANLPTNAKSAPFTTNAICTKYEISARGAYDGGLDKVLSISGASVWIKDSSFETASALVATLSGVMLYYELATPVTTPIDPPLNLTYRAGQGGMETVLVPTGEMSAPVPMVIVYGSTPDGILDRSASLLAAQDGPTATANHAIGSYLTMGGQLYRVTTAIASGEAIVPGTNVTATTVMAEILSLIQ